MVALLKRLYLAKLHLLKIGIVQRKMLRGHTYNWRSRLSAISVF